MRMDGLLEGIEYCIGESRRSFTAETAYMSTLRMREKDATYSKQFQTIGFEGSVGQSNARESITASVKAVS